MAGYYESLMKQREAEGNPEDEMIRQYQDALKLRETSIANSRDRLADTQQEEVSGLQRANLGPLLAFADGMNNTNMAQAYRAPQGQQRKEFEVEKLRQAIGQQEAGLIDDRFNVTRLMAEERRAQDKMKFGEQENELNRALRERLLSQRLAGDGDLAQTKAAIKQATAQPKAPSADAFKAAGFAKRIDQSEEIFADLASRGYNGPDRGDWAAQIMPREMQGNDYKSYDQSTRNFINATLRRESGAAISPTEFSSARAQYLPEPGDTPELQAQKAANRRQVRENLKAEGGSAYGMIPSVSGLGKPAQEQPKMSFDEWKAKKAGK